MALMAAIKDGQVVETASQDSLSKSNQTKSNDMNKDTFLQLLVAQMKYQDPMEPTSNTEYIAQYAQFSQVEAISSMASSMDLSRLITLYTKTENPIFPSMRISTLLRTLIPLLTRITRMHIQRLRILPLP